MRLDGQTAIYVLVYLLLCGAALAAMPREVAAAVPHNGTLTKQVYLPVAQQRATNAQRCAISSEAIYEAMPIPVDGAKLDRPPAEHGDVNLALRSYVPTDAFLGLVVYGGPADEDAPQMAGMLSPARRPTFVAAYQVHDWDWTCGADGCRGALLRKWPVTLLGLEIAPGTPLAAPSRRAEIHAGGFVAFVLYAEEQRITLKYTRTDSVVRGYTVHLEDICVDPNLVALYRQLDAAGRRTLPALRNGEQLGTVGVAIPKVAIRDEGEFMDPRSANDWWKGYTNPTN